MDKSSLRHQYRSLRAAMNAEEVSGHSKQVAEKLQAIIDWQAITTLHVYLTKSEWNEVDTSWLGDFLQTRWPHIKVTFGDSLENAALPSKRFDLIIVPLLAFDSRCYRLGMGGGWYDRFLALQPGALKVGLAYDTQHIKKLPHQVHDVALDYVITETQVFARA